MMETETTQTPPPASDRPLRRSSSDRVIAGVAGGIATRLDIPAWVVRVAFVVLSFGGGLGVVLYIAGWLLIPADGETEPIIHGTIERIQDGGGWLGVALVGLGVLIVASSIDFIRGDLAVAVFIAVIGVMLYRGEFDRRKPDASSEQPPTSPKTPDSTTTLAAPTAGFTEGGSMPPVDPPAAPPAPARAPKPAQPQHPPSILGRLTVALALIATGLMAFFDYAVSTFDPTPRHYLGLILGIVGVGLVVGSVLGRARGLIFVGIFVAPLLIFSPLAEFDMNSGIGQRRVTLGSVDEIAPSYELAIGELVIDLRQVDFSNRTIELDANVGIGSLRVLVPNSVAVEVDAEVGIGEAQAFGVVRSGFARTLDVSQAGSGLLILDAQTLVGEVRVTSSDVSSVNADAIDLVVFTPGQLENLYQLQAGDIRLDLSNLVLRSPRTVNIQTTLGRIEVIVPSRSTTAVNAQVALGEVSMYGSSQGGVNVNVESPSAGEPLLTLNLEVNSGEIVVEEG